MKNLLINRALAAKKKKIFTLLLAVAASVGTMFAESGTCGENLTWDLTDGVLTISGTGAMKDYYSNKSPWYNNHSSITSVTIGTGVTSIGDWAFSECSSLTSVTIPNSVTSIGDWAFSECSSLTSVTIPNSVTSIGDGAFSGCNRLNSITIPNSVTSIGERAFSECSSLTSVTIPNSVTSIGDWAFGECTSLTSVTIPNSVTSIGYQAFYGCSSLTSVTIPNSVTSIGDYAFSGCTSLTSPVYNAHVFAFMPTSYSGAFTIPDGIESIAGGAFGECTSLTSVTIPNSVTSIGGGAFYNCSSLTSPVYNAHVFAFMPTSYSGAFTIPDGIESIAGGAFYDCSGLTSVTIGNSVASIGGVAFYNCSSLTSVTINSPDIIGKTYKSSYNIKNIFGSQVTQYIIGNSVTSIGEYAFQGCTGLTSVTIGNSVTSIGSRVFSSCTSLTSVTIEAETPPTLDESAFYICESLISIYVPCGTLDSYKTAEGWSKYQYRIKYASYPSYTINKKAENGHITTSSTDIFTMCDTEHPVICTANPDRGCYFVRWADGNTENPRTIELSQDTTMEAIFDYLLSGKCGKDSALTWTFEPASMALNITGKGALSENYTYGTFIESLTIGNEITSIGKWAFGECNNLKTVIIGSSVKVLEQGAFAYCSSIESITCYSQRPPTVNEYALYGLDYGTIVYVPADYLNTYQMHDAWGLYDVRPLGAKGTETTDINVTPAENTAEVAWPAISGAAIYELVIKDKSGNVICTLIFNANGQLTQIAFNAPARNNAPQQTQAAGFSFTVTGLENGTSYDLTITSKDNNGGTLDTKTISFTTTGATAIDELLSDQVQCTKVIREGQIFILRGDKTYTLNGQETIMP